MDKLCYQEELPVERKYDILVAGGGVAGVAAALAARRAGRSVLLLEKGLILGGLATSGLINMFVPMCNGRGVQIIKGMCEELLRLSIQYGYDTIPDSWKNGEHPTKERTDRYLTRFSPGIFAVALTELLHSEGVDLLLDCIASAPVMQDGRCTGLIVQSKAGRSFYPAGVVVDTTGDADLLYRAGIPTVLGKNYFTYVAAKIDLKSCERAVKSGNIRDAVYSEHGGHADLYGNRQPPDVPLYSGTTPREITDFTVRNQLVMLEKLKGEERNSRDIVTLPTVPQFRSTRHIDGAYTLQTADAYRHFDDSIGAICDFDHSDILYEVPYRTLIHPSCVNMITAGRSAAAQGYAWDVLRVIPPAIITGQAAGEAAALALEQGVALSEIQIAELQRRLSNADVMIHFDDRWVPKEPCDQPEMIGQMAEHL